MGLETIKSLYSVIQPLLVSEDHKKYFEDVLLPNWTSFTPLEDSKIVYIPIINPNSDFRMNERIFKYEESGFKEQNKKKLVEEGLYFDGNYGKKHTNQLEQERQRNTMNTFVDSVKILSDHPDSRISSFDILAQNDDLYMNLGKKSLERIHQDQSYHNKFYEN
jgi:hypothetical protein